MWTSVDSVSDVDTRCVGLTGTGIWLEHDEDEIRWAWMEPSW